MLVVGTKGRCGDAANKKGRPQPAADGWMVLSRKGKVPGRFGSLSVHPRSFKREAGAFLSSAVGSNFQDGWNTHSQRTVQEPSVPAGWKLVLQCSKELEVVTAIV